MSFFAHRIPKDKLPADEIAIVDSIESHMQSEAGKHELCCPPSKILECLYLGGEADARNEDFVKNERIGLIVNVATEVECAKHDGVMHMRFPIKDLVETNQHDTFEKIFVIIDIASRSGVKALIHCSRGRSRSATIVIAYLMSRKNWTLAQALQFVKEKRSLVSPHKYLQVQLRVFENHLQRRPTLTAKL